MILFFISILISCNGASTGEMSSDISGKVIAIIDGDTYDVLIEGNKTLRIRMEGIDAPERGMPFYQVSKKYLGQLCFKKTVRLEINDEDSRNRKIAFAFLDDGRELSHEMVKAGLAWHFKKYNSDEDLALLEKEAKENKRGLWIDESPMPPWVNRSLHRQGISTKDSFNLNSTNK